MLDEHCDKPATVFSFSPWRRPLAATESNLSGAMLDVNLGNGEFFFPAANLLRTRGAPYVFATGYGSVGSHHDWYQGAVAVLIKFCTRKALAAALGSVLDRAVRNATAAAGS